MKQKLDPKTWAQVLRIMIYILQMILGGIDPEKLEKHIKTLEERLRTRFEWGLTVDIGSPDYETRMAILRKKEEMEGYNIDHEVIQYIATNIVSNIISFFNSLLHFLISIS